MVKWEKKCQQMNRWSTCNSGKYFQYPPSAIFVRISCFLFSLKNIGTFVQLCVRQQFKWQRVKEDDKDIENKYGWGVFFAFSENLFSKVKIQSFFLLIKLYNLKEIVGEIGFFLVLLEKNCRKTNDISDLSKIIGLTGFIKCIY